ncbi:glycosyltransferase [Erwinia sp. B116]|uniref:glycosyltransferase n=1 Tax=Erwinia sp. B116 TaxID=1561024 RepID=UPI000C786460|nr:glycosyltransferase [Erwinia sp. B116]PLV53857.1 hypothetical protein NV64_18570 [Erwinia sp. B116]
MISVCMATYNGEHYIHQQLLSILKQLDEHDEVIISDDGSQDSTLAVIAAFNDPRVTVISHSRDWLPAATPVISRVKNSFSSALEKAQGEFIFLSDQDDEWLEGRVAAAVAELQSGADLVVCDCKVVDDNHQTLINSWYEFIPPSKSLLRTLWKSSFHGCCMAFRAEVLRRALPFPDRDIGHDTWLGLMACWRGKVTFVAQPYILYRRHGSAVTHCGFKSERSLKTKLLYRKDLMLSLLTRMVNA